MTWLDFVIGVLTFILVLNCLFLMLFVLMQLPKKEAGAGVAFGGAATDALFGAGSGNALTRLTRYATTLFLALSLVITVLYAQKSGQTVLGFKDELEKRARTPAAAPVPTNQFQLPTATNQQDIIPLDTNAAPAPAQTNAPAEAAPAQEPAETQQPEAANPASGQQ